MALRDPSGMNEEPEGCAQQGGAQTPPVRKRKVRLASLVDVRREFARLYRDAVNGEMDAKEARTLASVLYMLRSAFMADEMERRMEAMEAELKRRFGA